MVISVCPVEMIDDSAPLFWTRTYRAWPHKSCSETSDKSSSEIGTLECVRSRIVGLAVSGTERAPGDNNELFGVVGPKDELSYGVRRRVRRNDNPSRQVVKSVRNRSNLPMKLENLCIHVEW